RRALWEMGRAAPRTSSRLAFATLALVGGIVYLAGEAWAAGGDVAVACAVGIGAEPEGVELAVGELAAKFHGAAFEDGEIDRAFPVEGGAGGIGVKRFAIREGEGLEPVAAFIEDLGSELALVAGGIYEEMLAMKRNGAGDYFAPGGAGI